MVVKIAQIDGVGDTGKFWGCQSLPVSSDVRIGGFKKKAKITKLCGKIRGAKFLLHQADVSMEQKFYFS